MLEKANRAHSISEVGAGIAREVTTQTCTVERGGQATLYDVRLAAIEDASQSYCIAYPAEGSSVIYGIIDSDKRDAVLIRCSAIDRVAVFVGTTELVISADGYLVKRGNDTLQKLLGELIDEVTKIIVVNGTSPNVAALTSIKNRFNQLLK